MKKAIRLVAALFALTLCFGSFTACTSRSEKLVIRNWGEYMDPAVHKGFEAWYLEKTGKKVKVDYSEFDTNEDMYTAVSIQKTDYDLVCPSDYMAERMIKKGLAQKIDTSIFDVKQAGLFYDGLMDMATTIDPNNEYFVPYVWGTMGIMYDGTAITGAARDKMNSWEALWSSDYSGKIMMKNSVRDSYSIARIYENRAVLNEKAAQGYGEEYKAELARIFETASNETIQSAQDTLLTQKPLVCKYEVDDGKDEMLSGQTEAELGLFWSCDAGYIMNDETGAGQKFMYSVPKEGSNVWVDGWIIPSTAKNTEAANWFLKYISDPEVAYTNMQWLGTSVAVKDAMDRAKTEFTEDGIEGADEAFTAMYIDMVFPSADVLARCRIMRDFTDEMNNALDDMWITVLSSSV